jgi:signal transduction histidine kinase
MRRLIDDLLTLARQGDIIESTTPVELAKPAESAWQTVETEDATLAIETDQEIVADRNRLEQLFGNLYRNAVEHGGPAVTVTVGDIGDGFSWPMTVSAFRTKLTMRCLKQGTPRGPTEPDSGWI